MLWFLPLCCIVPIKAHTWLCLDFNVSGRDLNSGLLTCMVERWILRDSERPPHFLGDFLGGPRNSVNAKGWTV